MTSDRARRGAFAALSVGFALAGLYHLVAVGVERARGGVPAWRHGVFVGVNALVAYGLARRPRWFVGVFALLTAQQLVSHGGDLVRVWRASHRIDAASLVVVLAVPLTLGLLLRDLTPPPEPRTPRPS